jgi:hypothetical protein
MCQPAALTEAPATAARPCGWCGGAGFEPTEELGAVPCLTCNGGGYALITGDLGPTPAMRAAWAAKPMNAGLDILDDSHRPFTYDPNARRLTFHGKGGKSFQVAEFAADREFEGRAVELVDTVTTRPHHLIRGRLASSCDCEAGSYWKGERFAVEATVDGRRVEPFPSYGCRHGDWLHLAIEMGWLDLPEAEPVPAYPADFDPFA